MAFPLLNDFLCPKYNVVEKNNLFQSIKYLKIIHLFYSAFLFLFLWIILKLFQEQFMEVHDLWVVTN